MRGFNDARKQNTEQKEKVADWVQADIPKTADEAVERLKEVLKHYPNLIEKLKKSLSKLD